MYSLVCHLLQQGGVTEIVRLGKCVSFVRHEGKVYAYNALNGGLCELEQAVYESMAKQDFDGVKSSNLSAYNDLMKTFYIVPDGFDEVSYTRLMTWKAKLAGDILSLTIAPTLDCNFRCFYCYQQNYKEPQYMTKETADKLVEFTKERIRPSGRVSISWYGGEPLLALNTIEYISKELQKALGEEETEGKTNQKLRASIVTNGYLLDERNAEILSKECHVTSLHVTLDGPKDIHDRRRPYKGGSSSFDAIMGNLKSNAHFFERVYIRINVDKTNQPFLSDLLKGLKDMSGNVQPYLAPVRTDNVQDAGFAKGCYDSKDFGLEVESKPELANLLMYPQPTYGVCGAVRDNSFCIDPEGYLYKCWNEVGQRKQSIGSVVDGITNYERYLKWMSFDPTDYHDCRECGILPICNAGNCPDRVLFPEEAGTVKACIPEKWMLEKSLLSYIERRARSPESDVTK